MAHLSLDYPCSQASHSLSRTSYPHGQGDLFYPDASGLHDFDATENLDPSAHLPPDSTNFNLTQNEYPLRIQEVRGRTPSSRIVFRTSVKSSFTSYQHLSPSSNVAKPPHVIDEDDQSLNSKQFEEELHRRLSHFLRPQGPSHDRNCGTDTTHLSGPARQQTGNGYHGQELTSDTFQSNEENVHHAAHPLQFSAPILDSNSTAPPSLSSANSADPLHVTNAYDQELSWRRQLEAYAYGNVPDNVQSWATAHGRDCRTDTAPFNGFPLQGTSYGQDFTSDTSRSDGESFCSAVHPLQPPAPIFGSNSAAPPPVSYTSYVSNPIENSSRIKSEHYEPPRTSSTSDIPATRCLAPTTSNHIRSGSIGVSSSLHHPHRVSKLNNFEPLAGIPVPLPRRQRRRQRRLLPKEPHLSGVDRSDISTPPYPTPHAAYSGSVNPSETPIPGHPIDNTTKLEIPMPSNISKKDEVNEYNFFNEFLDMEALIETPSNDYQVGNLNAPNVNNQNKSDTLKPCAVQNSASQPIRDADMEQLPQPQKRNRKRTLSAACSTTAPDPHQPEKKPRRKLHANPVRTKPSRNARRTDPKSLHWCADPGCHASQQCGFAGFQTREDTRRHLLIHEPPTFFCKLCHKEGERYCGRRLDNLIS